LLEAIPQIISAAFGSAGERCMVCVVVVAVGSIADRLVEGLMSGADQIRIDNGLDENVLLGSVIRAEHRERTLQYIEIGIQEGTVLVRD